MAKLTDFDSTGAGNSSGIGTGAGASNGNNGSSGNRDIEIGTGAGAGNVNEKSEANKATGETVSVIEVKSAKRGRPAGSTNKNSGTTAKKSTKKNEENSLEIGGLFTTIVENMIISRFGSAAEFTGKEKEILEENTEQLLEKLGISSRLNNSPLVNIAMIGYVFACVGMRVNAAKPSEPEHDFSNEIKQYPTRVPSDEPLSSNGHVSSTDFASMFGANNN